MIFEWFRQRAALRATTRAAIAADARALIERHGKAALTEARILAQDEFEAGALYGRPPGHWAGVRDEVRRLAKGL
jgi:hypothetical protein